MVVTVVVHPRERFSNAVASLQNIIHNTDPLQTPYSLLYVDAGSPPHVATQLRCLAKKHDLTLFRIPYFLTQHEAKNLALAHIRTRYAVFMDNDVMVSEGWLEKMLQCCAETHAWAVLPLYLEGGWDEARNKPDDMVTTIHMAGGHCYSEWNQESGKTVFRQKHWFFNTPATESTLRQLSRTQSELLEYHTMLVDLSKLRTCIPRFDEALVSAHDHVDFSLDINASGGTIWIEPAARIYYHTPPPLHLSDLPFFLVRWSDEWIDASCGAFRQKWGLSLRPQHAAWHRSQRLYAFPSCPWLFAWIAAPLASLCHWFFRARVASQRRQCLQQLALTGGSEHGGERDREQAAAQHKPLPDDPGDPASQRSHAKEGRQRWARRRLGGQGETTDSAWQQLYAAQRGRVLPWTELLGEGAQGWKLQGRVGARGAEARAEEGQGRDAGGGREACRGLELLGCAGAGGKAAAAAAWCLRPTWPVRGSAGRQPVPWPGAGCWLLRRRCVARRSEGVMRSGGEQGQRVRVEFELGVDEEERRGSKGCIMLTAGGWGEASYRRWGLCWSAGRGRVEVYDGGRETRREMRLERTWAGPGREGQAGEGGGGAQEEVGKEGRERGGGDKMEVPLREQCMVELAVGEGGTCSVEVSTGGRGGGGSEKGGGWGLQWQRREWAEERRWQLGVQVGAGRVIVLRATASGA